EPSLPGRGGNSAAPSACGRSTAPAANIRSPSARAGAAAARRDRDRPAALRPHREPEGPPRSGSWWSSPRRWARAGPPLRRARRRTRRRPRLGGPGSSSPGPWRATSPVRLHLVLVLLGTHVPAGALDAHFLGIERHVDAV